LNSLVLPSALFTRTVSCLPGAMSFRPAITNRIRPQNKQTRTEKRECEREIWDRT
jgi:hypothetical protein